MQIVQPIRRSIVGPTIPRINRSSSLSVGLLSCIVPLAPGIFIDVAKTRVLGSGGTSFVGKYGQGVAGSWTIGAAADTADLNWTSGPFTAACWANMPANQNGVYLQIYGRDAYSSESVNSGWILQLRALDDPFPGPNFIIFNNNGGSGTPGYNFRSTATYAAGDHMLVGVSNGSSSKSIFDNLAKTTSANANFVPATCSAVLNGAGTSGVRVYIGCCWNRALSDPEVAGFYYNPFSLLTYREDNVNSLIMGTATGGGGFTPKYRRTLSPIGTRVGSRQAGAA